MSQITVISGIERRRRWTEQQKQDLVAAVSAPGANVAEIARRADIRPNQIYKWRRQMDEVARGFAEVKVQPDRAPVVGSMIVVEFERAIMRFQRPADWTDVRCCLIDIGQLNPCHPYFATTLLELRTHFLELRISEQDEMLFLRSQCTLSTNSATTPNPFFRIKNNSYTAVGFSIKSDLNL